MNSFRLLSKKVEYSLKLSDLCREKAVAVLSHDLFANMITAY